MDSSVLTDYRTFYREILNAYLEPAWKPGVTSGSLCGRD